MPQENLTTLMAKTIEDEWVRLERDSITPWAFMPSGRPFQCKDFHGKAISYQGVKFTGSPEHVFWGRYIEPFLEDIVGRMVKETLRLGLEKGQKVQKPLLEVGDLLKSIARRAYNRMAEIDQALRGEGFPQRVSRKNVDSKVLKMNEFIDARIRAEIAMADQRDKKAARYIRLKTLRWAGASLIGIIGTCVGLAYTYKTTGESELRSQIYQPLYNDVLTAEQSVQAVSNQNFASLKALNELKKSGSFRQVPSDIQKDLTEVFQDVSALQLAISNVRDLALREMSARIMQFRTDGKDRDWRLKIEELLRERSKSEKGFSDTVMILSNADHEMISPSIDLRNPNKLAIASPGGPILVLRDWITYPDSVKTIDRLWTDENYLYFSDGQDHWYYRMTKEDLNKLGTNLTDFLRQTFQVLKENKDFQLLVNTRPKALAQLGSIKARLEDRIRDPKQLRDLLSF